MASILRTGLSIFSKAMLSDHFK